jgi:hypothetical protein
VNRSAREHLDKAEGYLDKGNGFYRKAAAEIVAAQQADSTLSNGEIGKRFDKSATWVRDLVRWHTTALPDAPIVWSRGTHGTKAEVEKGVEKILRDAPMEQVERMVAKLPPARRQALAAAAEPTPYREARREYAEQEARMTPAQKSAREAAAHQATAGARQAAAGFAEIGIVAHLEQAAEELRELIDEDALNKRLVRALEKANATWQTELEVALGMVGLEVQ